MVIPGNISLKDEFKKYIEACYGESALSTIQLKEVEQAFISGVVVAMTTTHSATDMFRQARNRLMEIGSFPSDDN